MGLYLEWVQSLFVTFKNTVSDVLHLSYMSVSRDDVLVGCKLTKSHRSSCVKSLGGNSHFASESEFAAVGESCGCVDVK